MPDQTPENLLRSPWSAADPVPDASGRRRAWLVTAAVVVLVLVYLCVWYAYAVVHTRPRYTQLAPGAAAVLPDGRTRLLSLTRTDRLADRDGGAPQRAGAGATFVVAELELTPLRRQQFVTCSGVLLGPEGRSWESTTTEVQRTVPYCQSDQVVVGRPYRYEEVFLVPTGDVDRLSGIALGTGSSSARIPVMRPAV